MAARSTKNKTRQQPVAAPGTAGLAGVIALNLTNMAAVMASSGTVLLCLMIVKRF